MRLSQSDIDAIKTVVSENCGEGAVVRLFGSRLDDTAKGGDIDLMVELDEAVEHPARGPDACVRPSLYRVCDVALAKQRKQDLVAPPTVPLPLIGFAPLHFAGESSLSCWAAQQKLHTWLWGGR